MARRNARGLRASAAYRVNSSARKPSTASSGTPPRDEALSDAARENEGHLAALHLVSCLPHRVSIAPRWRSATAATAPVAKPRRQPGQFRENDALTPACPGPRERPICARSGRPSPCRWRRPRHGQAAHHHRRRRVPARARRCGRGSAAPVALLAFIADDNGCLGAAAFGNRMIALWPAGQNGNASSPRTNRKNQGRSINPYFTTSA